MLVRIVAGVYGLHTGKSVKCMDRRSGPFEMDDAEAEALIAAGVASAECGMRNAESESPAATGAAGVANAEFGIRNAELESPAATGTADGGEGAPSDDGDFVLPCESDFVAPDDVPLPALTYGNRNTLAELKAIADSFGLRYAANITKAGLLRLLDEQQNNTEGGKTDVE